MTRRAIRRDSRMSREQMVTLGMMIGAGLWGAFYLLMYMEHVR